MLTTLPALARDAGQRYADCAELPPSLDEVLGLWVDEPDNGRIIRLLQDLRRHPLTAHLPLFTARPLPARVGLLGDGVAWSLDEAQALARAWRPAATLLRGASVAPAMQLLRYLYLRPHANLQAQRDWQRAEVYHYPLVAAFADEGQSPEALLQHMIKRDWLEPRQLIDRLRHCERCRSVHLNYVDVCPACQSLDIENAQLLHCFTCGHVAPQKNFLKAGALCCPNCQTALRHIGTDYNRPLEQLHCRDCQNIFIESEVVARCLACNKEQEPAKLPVASIHEYGLSDLGRHAARRGETYLAPNPLSHLKNQAPETFVGILDWMLKLASRHQGGTPFSLIGLSLKAPAALQQSLGEVGLYQLLDGFAARLAELTRDTDIACRSDDNLFWLLLPQTDPKGAQHIAERTLALARDSTQQNGGQLQVDMELFLAPEQLSGGETGAFLLATLGGRLQAGPR